MAHYYAEKMFSPVLLSPAFKRNQNSQSLSEEVDVYIISELLEEMKNLKLQISVQRFDNIDDGYVQSVLIGMYGKKGFTEKDRFP